MFEAGDLTKIEKTTHGSKQGKRIKPKTGWANWRATISLELAVAASSVSICEHAWLLAA
jgi:hypothetical protein